MGSGLPTWRPAGRKATRPRATPSCARPASSATELRGLLGETSSYRAGLRAWRQCSTVFELGTGGPGDGPRGCAIPGREDRSLMGCRHRCPGALGGKVFEVLDLVRGRAGSPGLRRSGPGPIIGRLRPHRPDLFPDSRRGTAPDSRGEDPADETGLEKPSRAPPILRRSNRGARRHGTRARSWASSRRRSSSHSSRPRFLADPFGPTSRAWTSSR